MYAVPHLALALNLEMRKWEPYDSFYRSTFWFFLTPLIVLKTYPESAFLYSISVSSREWPLSKTEGKTYPSQLFNIIAYILKLVLIQTNQESNYSPTANMIITVTLLITIELLKHKCTDTWGSNKSTIRLISSLWLETTCIQRFT